MEQHQEKKRRGKTSNTILKADSYTAMKNWLVTIPNVKLPTNQKTER
jgi:hypothetical protein